MAGGGTGGGRTGRVVGERKFPMRKKNNHAIKEAKTSSQSFRVKSCLSEVPLIVWHAEHSLSYKQCSLVIPHSHVWLQPQTYSHIVIIALKLYPLLRRCS